MDINRNNYEAYLLDQMEGKLSLSDQQKLASFLRSNPDCVPIFDDTEPWVLEGHKVTYSGKGQLKKEFPGSDSRITESNFDLFSIARLEGDLTAPQEMEHEQMLEEDSKRREEWELWQHTSLKAPSLAYEGKSQLKKLPGLKRGVIWLTLLSSAAAIALLFVLLRVDIPSGGSPLAEQSTDQPASETGPQSRFEQEISSSEEPDLLEVERGDSLARVEKPVLFSIKKNRERPEESSPKGEALVPQVTRDTVVPVEKEKLEPRPLRLASFDPLQATFLQSIEYDRIEPLDIPPIKASISKLSLAQLAEISIPETVDAYKEEKDISFWSVANAGIQGINKITGANMSLMASRDEEGDVSGFRFKSKRFSVARPIERSE